MTRTRRGGPRGRTGCPTCRVRHVKCDERKPSCLNCTSTGRRCDFEQAGPVKHQKTPSSLELARLCTTRSTPWNDSQVALSSALGLPSNEQSNHFFHSFLHGCVPSLAEAMDSDFWQKGILRIAPSPVVQHAAIALGAVYEQRLVRDNDQGSLASSLHRERLEHLSSSRYATAIQVLRRRVVESSMTPQILEEVLAGCLLFVFLEILRGDDVAAVTHLDGAIMIYQCLNSTGPALILAGDNQGTGGTPGLEGLTKTFLRLDVQSVQYMGSRTPWDPDGTSVSFHSLDDIPTTFQTFLHARDNLYAHIANIMNFVVPPYGAEICFPGFSPHPVRGFDKYTVFHGSTYRDFTVPHVSSERRKYMRVLSRWKSAFQAFLQTGAAKMPEALVGCALLWLAFYTTRIKLAVAYTEDECFYDEQLPSFKKIIEHVEAYQKYTACSLPLPRSAQILENINRIDEKPRLKSKKKKDFSVYSNITYPLYYTALKCRYQPLRQRALSMLQNTESEGVWDAQMLFTIASFVVDVEETDLTPNPSGKDFSVPEQNRIHCLSLNIDKADKIIWLQYSRRRTTTSGEITHGKSDPLKRWRIDNTILTWDSAPTSISPTSSHHPSPELKSSSSTPSSETQKLPYRLPQTRC